MKGGARSGVQQVAGKREWGMIPADLLNSSFSFCQLIATTHSEGHEPVRGSD